MVNIHSEKITGYLRVVYTHAHTHAQALIKLCDCAIHIACALERQSCLHSMQCALEQLQS